MRLHSLKVRNYRVHREQVIAFDPQCTLIGGANEAGKSTIVEAVHRALFLKAKGNTEHHRAMTSNHGGNPEVELTFDVGGDVHVIKKRFGASGTTTLIRPSAGSVAGEQAEAELAELLKVQPATASKALLSQWAHLWVWQGKACEDPSAHATALKEDLFRRLQSVGAAALLQSELDARVAAHFAEARAGIFTTQGKLKANSPLDQAERAVSDARTFRDAAAVRLAGRDSASVGLDAARAELPRVDESLVQLAKEHAALAERMSHHAELQKLHVEAVHAEKSAADRHGGLKTALGRIATLESTAAKREETLAPLKAEVGRLSEALASARQAIAESERRWRTSADAAREARARRDVAVAKRRLFELRKTHEHVTQRQNRVKDLLREVAEIEKHRAQLPELDAKRLRALQKLESELDKARHALRTFAAAIEVVTADQPVVVEGMELPSGETKILVEETDVRIGAGIHLRVRPGGGTTLDDARQLAATAEKNLMDALDALGLASVARATEVLAEREQIHLRLKTAQAQLEALDAAGLEAQLLELATQITASQGAVERHPELRGSEPADEAAAIELARGAEAAVAAAEDAEHVAKLQWDAAARNSQQAEESLTKKKTAYDGDQRALEELKAELRFLVKAHGEERARFESLLAAEAELKTERLRLEGVSRQIANLQPELLPRDSARLERALSAARERRAQLQSEIAAAEAILRSDGADDPQASLAIAEEKLRAATDRQCHEQRHARAIAMLHECFQEEQRALAEQFTRPLAEKISAYLQCLFGPSARATVELTDNGFTGLMISRGEYGAETYGFDALSGGTREQTAAAARLALAEVLAAGHDGCLPVVFDDAFVYSDPYRVHQLQRMLDLAASRGLQVIVLTCNPSDYAALGASFIMLPRRADQPGPDVHGGTSGDNGSCGTGEKRAQFVERLRAFGGKAANTSLREALGMDEAAYESVKRDLAEAGEILLTKDRGGSVFLVE